MTNWYAETRWGARDYASAVMIGAFVFLLFLLFLTAPADAVTTKFGKGETDGWCWDYGGVDSYRPFPSYGVILGTLGCSGGSPTYKWQSAQYYNPSFPSDVGGFWATDSGVKLYYKYPITTNYWAFTVLTSADSDYYVKTHTVYFYNETGFRMFGCPWGTAGYSQWVPGWRVEFEYEASIGSMRQTVTYPSTGAKDYRYCTCGLSPPYNATTPPVYVEVVTYGSYWGAGDAIIDNFVIGDEAIEPHQELFDILPGGDTGWYIKKDLFNPAIKGLFDSSDTFRDASHYRGTYGLGGGWAVNWSANPQPIQIKDPNGIVREQLTTVGKAGGYAGAYGWMDFNVTNVTDSGAPYGLWSVSIPGTTAIDYFWYVAGGATIMWEKEDYAVGETAHVNWTISPAYWDPVTYDYSAKIIYVDGSSPHDWTIGAGTGDEYIPTEGWNDGDYFAVLIATDKNTGAVYDMAFDMATFAEKVVVTGHTRNAVDGVAIPSAWANLTQSSTWYNQSTIADGSYNQTDLSWGSPLYFYAAKTGFTHNSWSFTPPTSGLYEIDLYLRPDLIENHTAIVGNVLTNPEHQAVSGATVRISNDTWTGTSTTSNATGYYMFDYLAGGASYRVNATKTGYDDSSDYTVAAVADQVVWQDILMSGQYDLTVYIRDHDTTAFIVNSTTVEVVGRETKTTSTGTVDFSVPWGLYTVKASVSGYYSGQQSVYVNEDRNITFYLTPVTAGGGSGIYYMPHNVKFVCRDSLGNPIANVNVTASYIESSGPLAWLESWLGLGSGVSPQTTTLTGTTGTDGAIDFMMIESLKYHITAFKAGEIDTSMDIYPKDDYYILWASAFGTAPFGDNSLRDIVVTVSWNDYSASYGFANVTYGDVTGTTTSVYLQMNETFALNGTESIVGTYTNTTGLNFTYGFVLPDQRGHSFMLHAIIQNGDYGTIHRVTGTSFREGPLDVGIPESWLLYVSLFCLMFTALIVPASGVGPGLMIWSLEGWMFFAIGWLRGMGSDIMVMAALTLATMIALFFLIAQKHKATGG